MFGRKRKKIQRGRESSQCERRLNIIISLIFLFGGLVILRLFVLQIIDHSFYSALASGQHEVFTKLFPVRGEVFVQDYMGFDSIYKGELNNGYVPEMPIFPYALNKEFNLIYAVPKEIEDPRGAAEKLSELLFEPREQKEDEEDITYDANMVLAKDMYKEELTQIFLKENDPYEPVKHKVEDEIVNKIKEYNLKGIYWTNETFRLYPEDDISGHVVGFVGFEGNTKKGKYGIEGYWEQELAGIQGEMEVERDAFGRWITLTEKKVQQAQDGSDIILTIDRNIQFFACNQLYIDALKHGADAGSVIVMDVPTGKILAMCSYPEFDPNKYEKVKNISDYNNQAIFSQYEPGSVFKAITMAAALDSGKVEPNTTFEDTGEVKIDKYTIKNSDEKAHGICSMTNILELSLNTGAIFAMRQAGPQVFKKYVKDFGFGALTGIKLETEVPGNISSLDKSNEVYFATASYGQGITVTPLQMVAAFNAIANKGKLMKPYIVEEIVNYEGEDEKFKPKEVGQVISEHTANLLSGMLVAVVKNGYGKRAGVDGYYVAGKTGTAQVADPESGKYYEDVTIHSFVGFAPVDNPRFTMIVRLDNPKSAPFAESTATPLFGEIAKFILTYFSVPTEY